MRVLAAILCCLSIAACSSTLEAIPEPADPAPTLRSAAADIKRVAGEAKLIDPIEVAGPIEAKLVTVAPWIICVRSKSPEQSRQIYALFYRDMKLVSSKMSAIVDRCEQQTFVPL